jgi:hypothetical protein
MFLWWYILRKSGAANFQEQIFEFVWIQCRPWKHQVMIICWKDKDFKRQLSPEQILKSYHETSRSHLDKVCKSHIFPHCLNMGSCGKYMLIAFPSLWLVLWTKNTFWDFFKVGFRKRVWHWYWQCFKFQKPFLLYPATCVCVALMPPSPLKHCVQHSDCALFEVFESPFTDQDTLQPLSTRNL